MNRNQGLRVRSQVFTLLVAVGVAFPVAAQAPKSKKDAGHDFVFLAEARPLLVRVHVRVDGKTLQEVHDDFMAHLFRHLDIKGKGYLTKEDAERAPLGGQIKSGSPGSMFGGAFGGYGAGTVERPKPANSEDDKITPSDLSAYYHKQGLVPFQVQPEIDANKGGMMMVLGGAATEPTVSDVRSAIFLRLDPQRTGRLTKAQLAATPDILLRLDANEDEIITISELVPPTPRANADKMDLGMMKGGGPLAPNPAAAKPSLVFLVTTPGETPADLVTRMQKRYTSKDGKLTRQALGLDEATFKALDADGDGFLDAEELGGFVKRAPDLEFVVHLGDAKGVEAIHKKAILGDKLKAFDGLALLDLPTTRIEFRGDGSASADNLAAISRLQWTALFKQADKDSNGYLDEKEAKANPLFSSSFKAMDRDGDGKVTEQEFNAYLDFLVDLQGRAKKACVSLVLSDESRGLFDLLDTNRDGRLSVREMRAAPGLLAKFDRQGKGFITEADLPRSYRLTVRSGPANGGTDDYSAILARIYGGGSTDQTIREPTKGPLWFRKMDKNRDGDVSRREWLGSEEMFRQIDTDGDGLISAEEADRFDAKSRKR
jgi:Ca2+-binding EF-hand superfamily protein